MNGFFHNANMIIYIFYYCIKEDIEKRNKDNGNKNYSQ